MRFTRQRLVRGPLLIGALLIGALTAALSACVTKPPPRSEPVAAAIPQQDDAYPAPIKAPRFDPQRSISVHLLDVGQGAATLIEFPCGAMLVDTGGELNESFDGPAALRTQLEAFFARRSDLDRTIGLLVLTHPHIDHLRGLPLVLNEFHVQNVVDSGKPGDELVQAEMGVLRQYLLHRHGTESTNPGGGYRGVKTTDIVLKSGLTDDVIDPFVCAEIDPVVRVLSGGWDVDPGWGTDNYGHLHFDDMNNHSVVVRVDAGNASVLISGDLEKVAIAGLIKRYRGTRWLDVDVYQVGHHGSANGTTRELLAVTTPMVALIAAGPAAREHNWTAWSYGHPRADVVDLLQSAVTLSRPRMDVSVAKSMKRFVDRGIDRAVYASGWDGPVVVDMGIDGRVEVRR